MSFRSAEIYVEPKTIKRLRLALTLYPRYKVDDATGVKTVITVDQIADQLLNEAVETHYPLVKKLEQTLAKTEKDFIAKETTNKEGQ